jgi:type I restriction enzyme R subunit
VVSSSQNDVATIKAKGGDIRPHRKRMLKEDLETKFKDADDPFRIVFVCAMWITGFDVPSCSTMYIDKPMRNHTLMQTIARANRVFKDKVNGLIVDYVGIFRHLEKALSIYGTSGGGIDSPVKHKDELKSELIVAIDQLIEYVSGLGVDIDKIRSAEDMNSRLRLFVDARDVLVQSEDVKKEYLKLANQVKRLYKAYLPDKIDKTYAERAYHIRKLVNAIRSLDPEVDIDEVMSKVDDLLDRSIIGYDLPETDSEENYYDLSQIDFAALKKKFESGRKKRTHTEGLKNSLVANINRMCEVNKSRMNYMEKLNELIKEYNDGARTVEEVFQRLVQLAEQLKEEEKRYIREELENEQQLAMFDLLTKPEPDLSDKEKKNVKAVSRILYDKLVEGILTLDWRKKQEKKAEVQVAIKTILNDGLPQVYDKRIFDDKRSAIYDYVYDSL